MIVDSPGYRQYRVKIDGSNYISLQNRIHLHKITRSFEDAYHNQPAMPTADQLDGEHAQPTTKPTVTTPLGQEDRLSSHDLIPQ